MEVAQCLDFRDPGTYGYPWLIHVAVWQKPTQYCKAIIFQLKIGIFFFKEGETPESSLAPSIHEP